MADDALEGRGGLIDLAAVDHGDGAPVIDGGLHVGALMGHKIQKTVSLLQFLRRRSGFAQQTARTLEAEVEIDQSERLRVLRKFV